MECICGFVRKINYTHYTIGRILYEDVVDDKSGRMYIVKYYTEMNNNYRCSFL